MTTILSKLKPIGKSVTRFIGQNSANILTGIGICGVIATAALCADATIKATKFVMEENALRDQDEQMTPKEVLQECWRYYISTAVSASFTVGAIFLANYTHQKRYGALAAAYALSADQLSSYKDKIEEKLGTKKVDEIKGAIAQDKVDELPCEKAPVFDTGHGNTLFLDRFTGRYFRSDIQCVKAAINEVNAKLLRTDYVSLNDLYYEMDVPVCEVGDLVGWNTERGIIEIDFGTALTSTGEPCIVLEFSVQPKYDSTPPWS